MPDKLPRIPKLCQRKDDGRLYVTDPHLKRPVYFKTADEYEEWRQQFLDRIRRVIPQPTPTELRAGQRLTVAKLCAAYLDHALSWYRKDGRPTSEIGILQSMMRRLNAVAGDKQADRLRVADIEAMLHQMIQEGLTRRTINQLLRRVKTMARWAVRKEVLSGATLGRILAVTGLPKGRTAAREKPKVKPVELERVEKTLPKLKPKYRTMVLVQLHSGMRPGEICRLRPDEIDRSSEPWEYIPASYKTMHLHDDDEDDARRRRIFFGPKAREALEPLLAICIHPHLPLFRVRKNRPQTVSAYERAIKLACVRAGVGHWTPNQLRHLMGTIVRKAHGAEAARTYLGHENLRTTELYAEKDFDKAKRISEELG